jgi:hypothetical protein
MALERIEWNNQGFRDLLQSSEVEQLVRGKAETIADRANAGLSEESEGFRAHSIKASSRYVAYAGTTDEASVRAESENKVLSRAVGV